ncbi:MAG: hypothetical protein ABSG76_07145 [Xanthobacteraceae bacterium]|jgi:K+ transporter
MFRTSDNLAAACGIAVSGTMLTTTVLLMQTPDVPLTLSNCRMLGFDADLEHMHYFIGHEQIVRRMTGSAMDRVSFAVFAFLS